MQPVFLLEHRYTANLVAELFSKEVGTLEATSRGGHGSVNHINRTEALKLFGITEPNRLRFGTN